LKAKLDRNVLIYRHPAGEWISLALFFEDRAQCFVVMDKEVKIKWTFEKKPIDTRFLQVPPYDYGLD
jgi:hypothetical protein